MRFFFREAEGFRVACNLRIPRALVLGLVDL
jgi:hypothetical protein